MRPLVLAALVLAGCTGSIPVRPGASAREREDLDELLEIAGEVIGIPLEQVDSDYGAIVIAFVEDGGEHGGESLDRRGCDRSLWVEPDPVLLAHEIVHTLGWQGHVEGCEPGDPDHLMCPDVPRGFEPSLIVFGEDDRAAIAGDVSNLNSCTART